MKVQLLSDQSGRYTDSDGAVHDEIGLRGQEVDLPDELARDLIDRQQAVPVKSKAKESKAE